MHICHLWLVQLFDLNPKFPYNAHLCHCSVLYPELIYVHVNDSCPNYSVALLLGFMYMSYLSMLPFCFVFRPHIHTYITSVPSVVWSFCPVSICSSMSKLPFCRVIGLHMCILFTVSLFWSKFHTHIWACGLGLLFWSRLYIYMHIALVSLFWPKHTYRYTYGFGSLFWSKYILAWDPISLLWS